MSYCPFLSNVEQKVLCFNECAFYEYESSEDGCPFRKTKKHKNVKIKDLLEFDYDSDNENKKDDDLASSILEGYY